MNEPVFVPSVVMLSLTVGLLDVLQTIPRAVTVAPPSEVTLPPLVAPVLVMLEMSDVVTVGAEVVMTTSLGVNFWTLLLP